MPYTDFADSLTS